MSQWLNVGKIYPQISNCVVSANVYSTHALSSKELKPGSVTEPLGAEPLRLWLGFSSANHIERALRDSSALGPKLEQNEQIRAMRLPNMNNRG